MVSYNCLIKPRARIVVTGPSESGKSHLVKEMLLRQAECFERVHPEVHIFALHAQESYRELAQNGGFKVVTHIGAPPADFTPKPGSILIFDDLQLDMPKGSLASWFLRKSHHLDCSCVYISQSIFDPRNPDARLISLNASYFVIFRQLRDQSSLEILNFQLLGSGYKGFLRDIYNDVLGDRPHSYLFVDLHQECPSDFRFRSSIFPENLRTRVFRPQSEDERKKAVVLRTQSTHDSEKLPRTDT